MAPVTTCSRAFRLLTVVDGSFSARLVPAKLILLTTTGTPVQIGVEIEVARRTAEHIGLPSVIGRDVLDLFRLTIDRSTGLVALTDAQGDLTSGRWPDGEPRE